MIRPTLTLAGLAALLLAIAGCTHVKGIVLDPTQRPVTDAEFTVGIPNGLGPFARYRVDPNGRFDFQIAPTDETHLYLWDGKGDPLISIRKVDRSEISDHMTIYMRRGTSEF